MSKVQEYPYEILKVEAGNIYGHIELPEQNRLTANPPEIAVKLEFDKWGKWINYPYEVTRTFTPTEYGQDEVDAPTPGINEAAIDMGRKAHPILYRHRTPRKFFQRINKQQPCGFLNMIPD